MVGHSRCVVAPDPPQGWSVLRFLRASGAYVESRRRPLPPRYARSPSPAFAGEDERFSGALIRVARARDATTSSSPALCAGEGDRA